MHSLAILVIGLGGAGKARMVFIGYHDVMCTAPAEQAPVPAWRHLGYKMADLFPQTEIFRWVAG